MTYSEISKIDKKWKKSRERGFLDQFIYNIFKKPNETPNKKKM